MNDFSQVTPPSLPEWAINLEVMCRGRGRLIVQQDLGGLRGHASQLSHGNPDVDEEELFEMMMLHWCKGIKTELSKIVGAERAAELLDCFRNGKPRKA